MRDIFEKNLRLVFEKTDKLSAKDIELQDLGTRMTNVKFGIQTLSRRSDKTEIELFLDEG